MVFIPLYDLTKIFIFHPSKSNTFPITDCNMKLGKSFVAMRMGNVAPSECWMHKSWINSKYLLMTLPRYTDTDASASLHWYLCLCIFLYFRCATWRISLKTCEYNSIHSFVDWRGDRHGSVILNATAPPLATPPSSPPTLLANFINLLKGPRATK